MIIMQYENEKKSYLDLGEDCKVIFKVQLCLLAFCLFVYLVVCLLFTLGYQENFPMVPRYVNAI